MTVDTKGRELFIVDNSVSGWTGLRYLEQWSSTAKALDIVEWRIQARMSRDRLHDRPGGLLGLVPMCLKPLLQLRRLARTLNLTVLVQLRDDIDLETDQRYTVKRYKSAKTVAGDSWRHVTITLEPVNPDFEPIVITSSDEAKLQVIAELVEVLRR